MLSYMFIWVVFVGFQISNNIDFIHNGYKLRKGKLKNQNNIKVGFNFFQTKLILRGVFMLLIILYIKTDFISMV